MSRRRNSRHRCGRQCFGGEVDPVELLDDVLDLVRQQLHEVPERVDLHRRDQPAAVRLLICARARGRRRVDGASTTMESCGAPASLKHWRRNIGDRASIWSIAGWYAEGTVRFGGAATGVRRLRLGVDAHTVRCESKCQF